MDFEVGTPGQRFYILLDSGSDFFWVANNNCHECSGLRRYDHRISSTFKLIEEDGIELNYGSGGILGDQIQETVCLGTARACEGQFCTPICAFDMNIGSIYKQDEGIQ